MIRRSDALEGDYVVNKLREYMRRKLPGTIPPLDISLHQGEVNGDQILKFQLTMNTPNYDKMSLVQSKWDELMSKIAPEEKIPAMADEPYQDAIALTRMSLVEFGTALDKELEQSRGR